MNAKYDAERERERENLKKKMIKRKDKDTKASQLRMKERQEECTIVQRTFISVINVNRRTRGSPLVNDESLESSEIAP